MTYSAGPLASRNALYSCGISLCLLTGVILGQSIQLPPPPKEWVESGGKLPGREERDEAWFQENSGLGIRSLARAPQSVVVPGQPLVVRAHIENRSPSPQSAVICVTLDDMAGIEGRRDFSLAPGEDQLFDVHIPVPSQVQASEKLELTATLRVASGEREVYLQQDGKPLQKTLSVEPKPPGNLSAIAIEPSPPPVPGWRYPSRKTYSSYQLPVAARVDIGLTRRTISFQQNTLPLNQADWANIDLFILADPVVLKDAGSKETLRRFVNGGGRIWVMLDRLPADDLRGLLNEGQYCETIDTVQLNEFTVQLVDDTLKLSQADRTIERKQPIAMKRVVQQGGRVTHKINGWPAAIWMPIGHGHILITTLDSEGWIQPRANPITTDALRQADYETYSWATTLATEVNFPRDRMPAQQMDMQYPLQLIGNPVLPRQWVAGVLLAFWLALFTAGGWLWHQQKLPWLGVVGPGLAFLSSGGLMLAASWIRRDIPESVGRLQVVEVADNGRTALVHEQAAVYTDSSSDVALASEVDGIASPNMQLESGVTQFELQDFQRWRLTNPAWPPGTWRYDAQFDVTTDNLAALAKLNASGIEIELPSRLPSQLSDIVLDFASTHPLLGQQQNGIWRSDGSLIAGGDNWIVGSFISDEQQRRLAVYRQLLGNQRDRALPQRRLYGWTDLWPQSPQWDSRLAQRGSAIVSIPVYLLPPAPGELVTIPHGLVSLGRFTSGGSQTFAYNEQTRSWSDELTMSVSAGVVFRLPPEVLPLQVDSIDLELDITAPNRVVRLLHVTDEGPQPIVELDSPSIPWSATIEKQAILDDLSDGNLRVLLEVGERTDVADPQLSSTMVSWKVKHLHLTTRGTILPLAQPTE